MTGDGRTPALRNPRHLLAIALGRLARVAARLRGSGGTAVPGGVVNRVSPGVLYDVINGFPRLVLVTGSSGKSTTTKMLVAIVEAHGHRVFTNSSTANISQGLMSAVLAEADFAGSIAADIAVLEMDEGHGAKIAMRLTPDTVVLTNVMTDQIDRFFDLDRLVGMLESMAGRATASVISNADDALLEAIVGRLAVPVHRFGVTDEVLASAPHGLGLLRTAGTRLSSGARVLGSADRSATIELDGTVARVELPARGVHYAADAAAALAAAESVLGDEFDLATAVASIASLPPVFARGETVTVTDAAGAPKRVELVLVQNPSSFQLNLDELPADLEQVLVAMGSDVADPSYLWPVDPSRLGQVSTVSGSKADDVALMLAYRDVPVGRVEPDLGRALDDFLALPDPAVGVKTIVFTADSMRRTRAHWGLA